MDNLQRLIFQARQKRDKAIAVARRDYAATMKDVRSIARRLGVRRIKMPSFAVQENGSLAGLTTVYAAEIVLRERQPLTLPELTLEVQRRGCRSDDDSRVVLNAIRNGIRHHPDRFSHDRRGRWSVVG